MTAVRPFRFTAQVPDVTGTVGEWRKELCRLEDMGFSTVALADHFTGGYTLEPFVMLTAAAMESTRLRVQSAVLGNDYRHPVLVHRAAATLDVMSEGRLELGIGAGWMRSDYVAAGLTYDRASERIDRLAESIAVLKGLFSGEPFTFVGDHVIVRDLVGVPPRSSARTPRCSSEVAARACCALSAGKPTSPGSTPTWPPATLAGTRSPT